MPIEDHGVIGNLETVALVGLDGAIDFMCFPHFDSPTIFSRLLDAPQGGFFRIAPAQATGHARQMYLPDTNVLVTRFHTTEGILEVIDFMPIGANYNGKELARIVKVVRGEMRVKLECKTTFDYGLSASYVELEADNRSALFRSANEALAPTRLYSEVELQLKDNCVTAEWAMQQGDQIHFTYLCDAKTKHKPLSKLPEALRATTDYWREWVGHCEYQGVWQGHVRRSALVLKLLFSHQHGSMVAAATFGLPEAIGGARNWDYRYCWIRDSAFTVFALSKIGFKEEALSFVEWITRRYSDCNNTGRLNLMYRIDGTNHLPERELPHFQGYRMSQPVRIGNAANEQLQLDIYGELIDSIYLANKNGLMLSMEAWHNIRKTVAFVCENWRCDDESIWEFRGERQHFLHSRLMCWVALDRAIRISLKNALPAPIATWRKTRDAIHEDILQNFWHAERKTFVQYKGGDRVDASTLLMPMVKFISPFDPMWRSTLQAIKQDLVTDVFVNRYQPAPELENLDGSHEGSFTMCSFWYCEILARSGNLNEAILLFEKMLGYANHLGIYAEEIGLQGEHLGNFPQAFTHLALIAAAVAIERAKKGERAPVVTF